MNCTNISRHIAIFVDIAFHRLRSSRSSAAIRFNIDPFMKRLPKFVGYPLKSIRRRIGSMDVIDVLHKINCAGIALYIFEMVWLLGFGGWPLHFGR